MVKPKFLKLDTLALHAGQQPDPQTGARAVPIYQSTSFVFDDTDHTAALYNLERPGHIYTRLSNPTTAVLEERVAAMEGGVGAVATASGMAALFLAVATLMDKGSHIVSSGSIYGGSHNLFTYTLPRFGIETTFVNPRDPDAFKAAIREDTRLVFGETLGNPGIEVMDVAAIADIAHDAGVPLMIDSTFTTPFLMKPYAGYHGLDFADEFGPQAFIMRARAEGMKDFGACISPANAFYILQGIETLPLRMARHVENAVSMAAFLEGAEEVEWVNYPSLASHPDYDLAQRILPKGCGSILSFGIKGGRDVGRRFIEAVGLSSHLANVGDAKTLVIHPGSTTHQQMNDEALAAAGIGEGMIRLSVGIEDAGDIIDDLKQALRASQRG